jgi:prepilin-type N-terminal cleavage/methylation domain-containing protein
MSTNRKCGFTLIELLLVVAVIAILAALLFPTLGAAKSRARRTICINNLRQINSAARMYADDFNDKIAAPPGFQTSVEQWFRFKGLVASYVGKTGSKVTPDALFTCPADRFYYSASGYHGKGLHERQQSGYSSYIFNAGNLIGTNAYPGIAGRKLVEVKHPSVTVLVCEAAAFTPWSWHDHQRPASGYCSKDSRDELSFVDGHVDYVKMYWNGSGEAWQYDPPAGYNYKWSGD